MINYMGIVMYRETQSDYKVDHRNGIDRDVPYIHETKQFQNNGDKTAQQTQNYH